MKVIKEDIQVMQVSAEDAAGAVAAPKLLDRSDRIALACHNHGLYMLGMATTESERIDEDCAMDNLRIPRYEEDLNEKERAYLASLRRFQLPVIDVFAINDVTGKDIITGTMSHSVPVALDDEGARELSRIMNLRRTSVQHNEQAEPDKQYEVISWLTKDNGDIDGIPFAISSHPTRDAADQAAEVRIAHLVYADLLLFQMRQAIRLNKQNPFNPK